MIKITSILIWGISSLLNIYKNVSNHVNLLLLAVKRRMFSIFSIVSCLRIKNHLPFPHGKRK